VPKRPDLFVGRAWAMRGVYLRRGRGWTGKMMGV